MTWHLCYHAKALSSLQGHSSSSLYFHWVHNPTRTFYHQGQWETSSMTQSHISGNMWPITCVPYSTTRKLCLSVPPVCTLFPLRIPGSTSNVVFMNAFVLNPHHLVLGMIFVHFLIKKKSPLPASLPELSLTLTLWVSHFPMPQQGVPRIQHSCFHIQESPHLCLVLLVRSSMLESEQ